MYLLKVIVKKLWGKKIVGNLNVTDEKSRILIRISVVRIRRSGYVPKCQGSGALINK